MSAKDRAVLEAIAVERAQARGEDGYRIGADDLLEISIPDLLQASDSLGATGVNGAVAPPVAEAPVFRKGFRVSPDGLLHLPPSLGFVRADGLTPGELEEELARRLTAGGILRQPYVSVIVAEHRSRVVAVVGSVQRPGLYPLTRPRATLADLIWAAGGPSRDAGRVVEFVPAQSTRTADLGGPIRVDLEVLLHATSLGALGLNPEARAGDVTSLLPAGNVLVDGWVDKPGSYPVGRGLTLTGAVAAAGGHLFAADRSQANVKRVLGAGEQRSFTVDLDAVARGEAADIPIIDGDVVRVPASAPRLVPWALWNATKSLVHVGGSVPLF